MGQRFSFSRLPRKQSSSSSSLCRRRARRYPGRQAAERHRAGVPATANSRAAGPLTSSPAAQEFHRFRRANVTGTLISYSWRLVRQHPGDETPRGCIDASARGAFGHEPKGLVERVVLIVPILHRAAINFPDAPMQPWIDAPQVVRPPFVQECQQGLRGSIQCHLPPWVSPRS
jgi:hypothetical protein